MYVQPGVRRMFPFVYIKPCLQLAVIYSAHIACYTARRMSVVSIIKEDILKWTLGYYFYYEAANGSSMMPLNANLNTVLVHREYVQ
jgi:hypothetical protein